MNKGIPTHVIYLDMSSAFDTVNHSILCDRLLNHYDLDLLVVDWIYFYLTHQFAIIKKNNICSEYFPLCIGVPQGSPLSAILFSVSIDPIFTLIISTVYAYADDIKILNTNYTILQNDLSISSWLNNNQLNINIEKTDSMIFALSEVTTPTLSINSVSIKRIHTKNDLGIIMDDKLTYTQQIPPNKAIIY